ncbi:glycosyltransferase family 4 protein [Henriciella sp.]|uniref:glycosyltransferase family 4 protein n=1 Tax=Henriciella sp. TaxID=1968823 RepID=UPI0026299237|nr:glycosyltransferase family 4 protein [Henriciella sp.]
MGKYSWVSIDRIVSSHMKRSDSFAPGPLYVAGFFTQSSGIAASAKLCATALEALDYEVHRLDIGELRHEHLLTDVSPPITEGGTCIIHVNPPELTYALKRLGISQHSQVKVIGYWAWELPKAPPQWISRSRLCHEVWVPSTFVATALQGAYCPVKTVPHPVPTVQTSASDQLSAFIPEKKFCCVCMFDMRSSLARKNPLGAIKAFKFAFPCNEDVSLIVKTQHGDKYPASLAKLQAAAGSDQRIKLVDAVWDKTQVETLIRDCDVFLSLHRAEGFGLMIAEAMSMAKPVIATAWSGNMDFLGEDYFGAIPAQLVPICDDDGIYEGQDWAAPDIAEAARRLRNLQNDPEKARAVGADSRTRFNRALSLDAYGALVRERLAADQPRNT